MTSLNIIKNFAENLGLSFESSFNSRNVSGEIFLNAGMKLSVAYFTTDHNYNKFNLVDDCGRKLTTTSDIEILNFIKRAWAE